MAKSVLEITPTVTSTITFKKTNAEVGQVLEWFISGWAGPVPDGLTQTQQNQWKLEQAHRKIVDYVIREARRNRLQMLRAADTSIEEQAESDTQL